MDDHSRLIASLGDDIAVKARAITIARELAGNADLFDVRQDIVDAVRADNLPALRAAVARAELDATPAAPRPGPRLGLPQAAAVDQVAAISAELGAYVAEGRIPLARQRAHTQALLGALYDSEALAFAVDAARRTMADFY